MPAGMGEATRPRAPRNGRDELRLVFWETTAGCNLECVHCRRLDVAREMMQDDLSTDEACRLVDQIAAAGNPILILSGGEPLIRPDVLEIAGHARGRGLTVSLATNGTLITSRLARAIRDAGIARVAVSLDGARAAPPTARASSVLRAPMARAARHPSSRPNTARVAAHGM